MPFFPQRHKNKIVLIFLSGLLCLLFSSLWWLSASEGFQVNYDDSMNSDSNYLTGPIDTLITQVNTASEVAVDMATNTDVTAKADMMAFAIERANVNAMAESSANAIAHGIARARPNPNAAKTMYIGDAKYGQAQADYDLNAIATDIINKNPQQQINWSKVEFNELNDGQNIIEVINQPRDKSILLTDACSTKSLLNSHFKTDICITHAGDNITINEKCQELSKSNCAMPSCCVFVNGRCMAGNNNGPTFRTHNGMNIDFSYYYHKNKLYGKNACEGYTDDSTNIPKDCMIQLWKEKGCTNTTLFDDSFVKQLRDKKKKDIHKIVSWYANNYKQSDMERCTGNAALMAKKRAVTQLQKDADAQAAARAKNTFGNAANNFAENPTDESTNSLLSTFKFSNDE